jgi:hypothetical protein
MKLLLTLLVVEATLSSLLVAGLALKGILGK